MTINRLAKGWSHHTGEVIVTSLELPFILTEPVEALIKQNGVQKEQQKITYHICAQTHACVVQR